MTRPFVKCVVASSTATFVLWYLIGTQIYLKVLLNEIAGPNGCPLLSSLKLAVDVLEVSNPVNDVAGACRTGVATNIILVLTLSYNIVVAALGMFNIIITGLAIDAYGPISDNTSGIAKTAGMSLRICKGTDAMDAAETTTSTIGIGIAISSTALVSRALSGAFVSCASISTVDVLGQKVFIGLIVRATHPYGF